MVSEYRTRTARALSRHDILKSLVQAVIAVNNPTDMLCEYEPYIEHLIPDTRYVSIGSTEQPQKVLLTWAAFSVWTPKYSDWMHVKRTQRYLQQHRTPTYCEYSQWEQAISNLRPPPVVLAETTWHVFRQKMVRRTSCLIHCAKDRIFKAGPYLPFSIY